MTTIQIPEAPVAVLNDDPAVHRLLEQLAAARAGRTPLRIRGGGTKDFYGETPRGDVLDTRSLAGVSSYEPTELVVTARAGTALAELEALLATHNQCLPFEPPQFGDPATKPEERGATVGGMVAAGLAGPARAAAGSVRDYVLGATLLNGRGEILSFGGQVMKNVAGYDVSRLLAGSLGTLGVILEVSLKVLPQPSATATLRLELTEAVSLDRLNDWGGQPLPLNASVWHGGVLSVRLSGALAAVEAAASRIGGERIAPEAAATYWESLRHQHHPFFVDALRAVQAGASLWRLSVPQTAAPLGLEGVKLIEWGGGQRWLVGTAPAATVRDAASRCGGHATLFRANDKSGGAFAPLDAPLARIHRALKASFDPLGLFNPGRLYPDL